VALRGFTDLRPAGKDKEEVAGPSLNKSPPLRAEGHSGVDEVVCGVSRAYRFLSNAGGAVDPRMINSVATTCVAIGLLLEIASQSE
jgi:hypothetical protein